MTQDHRLSDLQVAIMRVLWEARESTVAGVHEALQDDRGLALTTIATVLSRLEKRGLITHRREGRQFVYRPLVTEGEIRSAMVDELADLLFEGDVAELVHHLLSGRDYNEDDISRVKSMIEAHEQSEGGPRDDAD